MTRQRLCCAVLLCLGVASEVAGQTSTPPPPPDPAPEKVSWKDRMKEHLKEPDQAGGLHLSEHWGIAFGGIKQGSGIGAGPAWSTKFENGGFIQAKAVISIRNFRLLQVRYDTPRFWDGRAIAVSRVRWHHAPAVKLYALGPDSPNRRIEYDERRGEVSSELDVKLTQTLRTTIGYGVERFRTSAEPLINLYDPTVLALRAPLPGLATKPLFQHAFATLGYDTRLSPSYTRSGRFIEGAIHGYNDLDGDEPGFGRFEGTIEQYVPTHARRGVIGLAARAWLSLAEDQRAVPFYLTPTLGGGDLLRAYPSYRFRDRHAMVLLAQYRWAVHRYLDLATTYEVGKVSPTVRGLTLENAPQSIAIGVRAHTDKVGLLRADVAYGREGFGFRIGFTGGG